MAVWGAEQMVAASAFVAGTFGWLLVSGLLERRKRIRCIKNAIVAMESAPKIQRGALPIVLQVARSSTRRIEQSKTILLRIPIPAGWLLKCESKIRMAGLSHEISAQGMAAANVCMALALAAGGLILGAALSTSAMVVGMLLGLCVAPVLTGQALAQTTRTRSRALDAHLSEAMEVVCLGLRGGMTFDRALELYCSSFDSALSGELLHAMRCWQAGIASREKALQMLATSYDSHVLKRMVDGIVRSMRFGTPLADTLEALAGEARQAHKAAVQEQVMKAPVKMMLPIGLLILPSMLLLVMGPILLDLMGGM